jgi:hypothetical protein
VLGFFAADERLFVILNEVKNSTGYPLAFALLDFSPSLPMNGSCRVAACRQALAAIMCVARTACGQAAALQEPDPASRNDNHVPLTRYRELGKRRGGARGAAATDSRRRPNRSCLASLQPSTAMLPLRVALTGLSLALVAIPASAITFTQFNVTMTENFDTLATSTSSVVPVGWEFSETGSGANATYGASTGSSSTGNTYSFGSASSTDRAFGAIRTTSLASTLGTVITNQTGGAITQLTIQYTGEQWRLGSLGRVDRLDFGYSLDATSIATGSWLEVDALDFIAPVTSGAIGALDGNAAGNWTLISHTITGLNVAPGSSLWLRWTDSDATSSDDGLAIDNVAITAVQPVAQSVPDHLPLLAVMPVLFGLAVTRSFVTRSSAVAAQ